MATKTRRIVCAALAIAMVTACTAQAQAQLRFRLRRPVRVAPITPVAPHVLVSPTVVSPAVVSHPVPFLGFSSFFDGSGEQITGVQYGSAAWRIGLEPGDRIVAVNGVYLRYHGHGLQLLQRATAYPGQVTLAIRDVHTGLVVNRTIGLGTHSVAVTSSSPGYVVRRSLTPSQILRRLPR
jgi:predicted metalloprotease with PDZ domain